MALFDPPDNPQVDDHWIDERGDVWTWDGQDWEPLADIPFFKPTGTDRQ